MRVELRDETLAGINDYPGVERDFPENAPAYAQAVLRDVLCDIESNLAPLTYHRSDRNDYNCTCREPVPGRHYYDNRAYEPFTWVSDSGTVRVFR
jgi:hypothetical protein